MREALAQAAPPAPFLPELVKQWRAQDAHGAWDGKSDEVLLAPYVLTPAERRALPLMADPDPDTLWRMELFYNAVGLAIERATGTMVAPMIKIHHEGFGRVVLIAGRLVVLSRTVRDAHRFGFPSLEALEEAGSKLVAEAIAMLGRFPDAANHG